MNINELLLKTVFCCMSCDGNIAEDELSLIREKAEKSNIFGNLDVEASLNTYIEAINTKGIIFLKEYLDSIDSYKLSETDELELIELAIDTIEADKVIEYSEIKFFKKIRKHLKVSDEVILNKFPDKDDYLLPDVKEDEFAFSSFSFSNIELFKQ